MEGDGEHKETDDFITHYVTELGGVHKTHANVLISPFRIM